MVMTRRGYSTHVVLTYSSLEVLFRHRIDKVAIILGISMTALKRACRLLGIPAWPSRYV